MGHDERPPTDVTAPSVRGVDGPIRPNVDVTVEPRDGGAGSLVAFAFAFDAPAAGRVLLPLVRRMMAKQAPRSVRRLKDRLETGAAGRA
jgi:hypothetical protein